MYSGRGGEFYIRNSLFVNIADIEVGKFVKPVNHGMYFVDTDEKISSDTSDFAQIVSTLQPGDFDSGIPNVNMPVGDSPQYGWTLIRTMV